MRTNLGFRLRLRRDRTETPLWKCSELVALALPPAMTRSCGPASVRIILRGTRAMPARRVPVAVKRRHGDM